MKVLFPTSGVTTYVWLPPLVSFVISFFTSMGGVSGAFLLLPFQMSVLGFTSPGVSATNLVFNVIAIPSGVYRFLRERRLVWPLVAAVVAGTLPGLIVGVFVRLAYLPDPKPFKAFVGCVLLYIGARMFADVVRSFRAPDAGPGKLAGEWHVEIVESSWRRIAYDFQGQRYSCPSAGIFLLSLAVGVIGGIYGIGGGAIIAPFFVSIYRLHIHTVAGATLMGTFVTSVVGVAAYQLVAPLYTGIRIAPDWPLGGLFGAGGLVGIYLGARLQKRVPAVWLKLLLGLVLLTVAGRYLYGFLAA